MSAIAENLRRQRTTLLALLLALILGAGAWVLVSRTTAEHLTAPDYPVAAPEIEQAAWEIDYSRSAAGGKLSKADIARYSTERKRVGEAVTDIYDGIFLAPAELDDLVKRFFTSDAARSIATERLGLPEGATDVTTTERRARIALDVGTSDFAVAEVLIEAEAIVGERDVKVTHDSTLWLERIDADWKVVAFDLEQGPAK